MLLLILPLPLLLAVLLALLGIVDPTHSHTFVVLISIIIIVTLLLLVLWLLLLLIRLQLVLWLLLLVLGLVLLLLLVVVLLVRVAGRRVRCTTTLSALLLLAYNVPVLPIASRVANNLIGGEIIHHRPAGAASRCDVILASMRRRNRACRLHLALSATRHVQKLVRTGALGGTLTVENDNLLGQAAAAGVHFESEHARHVPSGGRRGHQVLVRHEEDVWEGGAEVCPIHICF